MDATRITIIKIKIPRQNKIPYQQNRLERGSLYPELVHQLWIAPLNHKTAHGCHHIP